MSDPKGYTIDQDTTDEYLDRPVPLYEGGKTLNERREARGLDTSDLGALAATHEERTGRPLPELPPSPDR